MDLDSIGLNNIRPSVYRVALKLLSLQKLCHLDVVSSRHITAAFQAVGRAPQGEDLELSREEVTQVISRIFQSVSHEDPNQVYPPEAPEEAGDLLLMTFDQADVGGFSQEFLQTVLVALSSDHLISKYRALLAICQKRSGAGSGLISRSGLRFLLTYLSKIPAVVQEGEVFGAVVDAVDACFEGVTTSSVSAAHAMSWLKSEPRLLLWLPTLYRLSVSQNVQHRIRCHTCRMYPITGLRYRCLRCVNVHMCQSCFLSQRERRRHKKHHPLMEYCTPVTWTESLSSLARRARHILLPQRRQREDTKKWGVPEETEDRAPAGFADADVCPSCRSTSSPCPPTSVGQSLDNSDSPKQQVATPEEKSDTLRDDIVNLQRDKWLLEQEVKAWRLTVQSEQGLLEDRCYQMEVTMETLRQQNLRLQGALSQTLIKLETKPQTLTTDSDIIIPQATTDPEDRKDQILPPTVHYNSAQTTSDHEDNQSPAPTVYSETLQTTSDHEDPDQSPSPTIHWELDPEDQDQSPSPTIHQGEHQTLSYNEEDQSPSPTIYCETLYINSDPEEHDQSPGPTIHQGLDSGDKDQSLSPKVHHETSEPCVQRSDDDVHERFCHQMRENEVAEDDGKCSAEEQIEKAVDRLKKELEAQRHTGDRKWAGLVVAAEQVGGAVHSLVDALMWDKHGKTQVTETFTDKILFYNFK
ncbi:dystrotelin isoform X2 [Cynoglossus semilaevis]|uniref:dystrotelin isoform X2 n=1 Tax=Cynoglossus semilaevis TaxID=244447 RepID=UPI000D624EE5|nr:dystrotelin isoform X2 [Cynoglossus semilaevis]